MTTKFSPRIQISQYGNINENIHVQPALIKHVGSEGSWNGLQTYMSDRLPRTWLKFFEDTMFDFDGEEVGVEKYDEETAEFLESASWL